MNRALGELQRKALNEQCEAGGDGKRRGFLEVAMPELNFKGQEVHLNTDSHSHTFYGVPGEVTGCARKIKI